MEVGHGGVAGVSVLPDLALTALDCRPDLEHALAHFLGLRESFVMVLQRRHSNVISMKTAQVRYINNC